MVFDRCYWAERLEAKKAQLAAAEEVLAAAMTKPAEHMLDTGQSRQSVTNRSISELQSRVRQLEVEIATLDARVNGRAFQGRPAF